MMLRFTLFTSVFLLAHGTVCAVSALIGRQTEYQCKCYEGESCWPNASQWSELNATVNGSLQRAVPPGAVCYRSANNVSTYDPAQCEALQANWANETYQIQDTVGGVGNLWHYWTNDTCMPTDSPTHPCTNGYYPDYVIMATEKQHIKAGIDFARENNLRLVIRNTGHDFLGRSTGYGALAINTHSFKDVNFTKSYMGPGTYQGNAVTIGAGVQGRELYKLAFAQDPPVVVVGGECPTVGLAGGYIQGGGHGPMATFYGMAADHALSFELITADGQYVTANEVENPELFWAMKGGGPSTYAAVVSVTLKTFPEVPSAGTIININSTHTNDTELWWKGIDAFHSLSNHWVENGMFVYYELQPGSLHVQPFVGPNMTAAKINEVTKPLFDKLDAEKVPYSTVTKDFPTFFQLYIDMFEDETAGQSALVGGRLFTNQDIATNASGIIEAYKVAMANNVFLVGHIVGPGVGNPVVDNAIHPKWREASSFSITSSAIPGNASLEEKAAVQNTVTNVVGKALRDASPNGAAYVNEGDLEEPSWQEAYWGSNYARLAELKKTWDPNGVFYARTTPGTEDWEVIDTGTRLCKRL